MRHAWLIPVYAVRQPWAEHPPTNATFGTPGPALAFRNRLKEQIYPK